MAIVDIALHNICEAPWNANTMDNSMLSNLKRSLLEFGLVQSFVVRPIGEGKFEVLSGNQRLKILKEMGMESAPCTVIELDADHAILLAQALNNIHGEDDVSKKAELMKTILKNIPETDIISILPETAESLRSLSTLGQNDIVDHLKNWEKERKVRLKHLLFQLTEGQLGLIEQALKKAQPIAKQTESDNPNLKGLSLYVICKFFIEMENNNGRNS